MNADTELRISVDGRGLSDKDAQRVRTVTVAEAMNAPTQVSIEVGCDVDNTSNWTSPLDALVTPMAAFEITLTRGSSVLAVPARAASASWSLQPGNVSTLTIAGIDVTAELDREERDRPWAGVSDADVARELLRPLGVVRAGQTRPPDGSDTFTPHQRATDWAFLKTLAARNNFDVYVEKVGGTVTAIFDAVDPLAAPATDLDLAYGSLGGSANVQVQLLAGQRVTVTYAAADGTRETRSNDGKGHAMGTRSLGGATSVLRDGSDVGGVQDPAEIARALAEQSAFGADLSVTIGAPDMPLVRARRTVRVRGLGTLVSGKWLVKSVRHTVTQAGHTQALTLSRNALGDSDAGGALGGLASLAGSVGVSL